MCGKRSWLLCGVLEAQLGISTDLSQESKCLNGLASHKLYTYTALLRTGLTTPFSSKFFGKC